MIITETQIIIEISELPEVRWDDKRAILTTGEWPYATDTTPPWTDTDSGFRYFTGTHIGAIGGGIEYPENFTVPTVLAHLALLVERRKRASDKAKKKVERLRRQYEKALREEAFMGDAYTDRRIREVNAQIEVPA